MKIILFYLIICFGFIAYGQNQISKTVSEFWLAVDNNDNITAARKGDSLINVIKELNLPIDTNIAEIRLFTARAYSHLGDYNKSLEYNMQALGIYGKVFGKEHPDYAISLNNIGLDYSNLGDHNKSLEYNLQALEIREKVFGKEHPDYATSLNNIAVNYSHLGDYKKSLEYNMQALEIIEKVFRKHHPSYAVSFNNIASNYSDLGDYKKSLEYNMQALEISKKVFGKDWTNYARSFNNIAVNYSDLGDYKKSLEYNMQALEIREKILGKEHPDYATSLNNIALDYSYLGDYKKALEYNMQALEIIEKVFRKDHPYYAKSLNNIAFDYSYLGDYTKALEFNLMALGIYENALGKEHSSYAMSLNNIAVNYSDLGDYKKSLEFNLIALGVYENTLGKEHSSYAMSLNNIAMNYSDLGDYTKSLEFNLMALGVFENALGKEHRNYAMSLNNIAMNYYSLGNYTKALEFNLIALDIYENTLGKEHSSYAMSLNNIAGNYSNLGDYTKSLEFNLMALGIFENTLGKDHPSYALSLGNIAGDYSNLGDYNKSLENAILSTEVSLTNFKKNKIGLNDRILTEFKRNIESSFIFSTNIFSQSNNHCVELFNQWIEINGMLSNDSKIVQERLMKGKDTSLYKDFETLKLFKLNLNKYNEMTIQEKQNKGINTKALEKQIEDIEMVLSRNSKDFAELNRTMTGLDVLKSLKSNEVLVDFFSCPKYNFNTNKWTDTNQYLVFISDSKNTLVDYIVINDGSQLEQEIFELYQQEVSNQEYKTDLKSAVFYNTFWKPIADKIGDAKTIYVSLGGVYNKINLNTIYNPETEKYLIEEKDIRIVNSARDFVLSKEREKKIYSTNSASLFGFPDYNGNTTVSVDTNDYLASTRDLNQMWLDSLTRGGLKASPLPATKVEVEQIASTFQKQGWSVATYTGGTASETNIKKEQSPRVLHIATHGYFFEDVPMDKSNDRFLGMDRQQVVQDPMLRSGLLFTGANKTLQGEEAKGENGLLSAAEASFLDLRETELVVLSACETGKGEVKNSEGVYGLRRAFADAGAKNTIMSLWKVDDKVTQEFMTLFYDIWLNEKTSIREAFNRTQLEIKAKYPEPYYWGAFILVGE